MIGEYDHVMPESIRQCGAGSRKNRKCAVGQGIHRKEGSAPNRKNDCAGEQLSRWNPDYSETCKMNYPGALIEQIKYTD